MVSRASAVGCHALREVPSLRGRGSMPAVRVEGYLLPLQSGRGHWSQPQPVHALRIMRDILSQGRYPSPETISTDARLWRACHAYTHPVRTAQSCRSLTLFSTCTSISLARCLTPRQDEARRNSSDSSRRSTGSTRNSLRSDANLLANQCLSHRGRDGLGACLGAELLHLRCGRGSDDVSRDRERLCDLFVRVSACKQAEYLVLASG